MKFLLSYCILLISVYSLGQITLTENNFPGPGQALPYSTTSGIGIDYATTGPDMVWDFSEIEEIDKENENTYHISDGGMLIGIQFGQFAPDRYKADYYQKWNGMPLEQLLDVIPIPIPLPIDINGFNQFVKVTEEEVTIVGYGLDVQGMQLGFRSDSIEVAYELPVNYGDTTHTVGYTKFNFSPIYDGEIRQHRVVTSVVDGYGTLITPYGSFDNVLRIKKNIQERDSIRIVLELGGVDIDQWISIPRRINNYEWWDNEYKRPVLRVETEGIIGSEIITNVTFINNEDIFTETKVFPNPTIDFINLQSEELITEYQIIDANGKLVLKEDLNAQKAKIDVSHLSGGIYFLHCIYDGGKKVIRIMKG